MFMSKLITNITGLIHCRLTGFFFRYIHVYPISYHVCCFFHITLFLTKKKIKSQDHRLTITPTRWFFWGWSQSEKYVENWQWMMESGWCWMIALGNSNIIIGIFLGFHQLVVADDSCMGICFFQNWTPTELWKSCVNFGMYRKKTPHVDGNILTADRLLPDVHGNWLWCPSQLVVSQNLVPSCFGEFFRAIMNSRLLMIFSMVGWVVLSEYPLVNIQKAIENSHWSLIYLLKIVIFHDFPWFSIVMLVYQRVTHFLGVRSAFHWRQGLGTSKYICRTILTRRWVPQGRLGPLKKATPPLGPSSSHIIPINPMWVQSIYHLIEIHLISSHIISYRYISRWKRTRSFGRTSCSMCSLSDPSFDHPPSCLPTPLPKSKKLTASGDATVKPMNWHMAGRPPDTVKMPGRKLPTTLRKRLISQIFQPRQFEKSASNLQTPSFRVQFREMISFGVGYPNLWTFTLPNYHKPWQLRGHKSPFHSEFHQNCQNRSDITPYCYNPIWYPHWFYLLPTLNQPQPHLAPAPLPVAAPRWVWPRHRCAPAESSRFQRLWPGKRWPWWGSEKVRPGKRNGTTCHLSCPNIGI